MRARSFDDLSEYVYDIDQENVPVKQQSGLYRDKDSLKRFDALDFVIIDVDASVAPWMSKSKQLTLLFKMCKLAEKPVLATGAGMSQLVYYCATYSRPMQVINGNEKGGPLNKIHSVLGGDLGKLSQLDG